VRLLYNIRRENAINVLCVLRPQDAVHAFFVFFVFLLLACIKDHEEHEELHKEHEENTKRIKTSVFGQTSVRLSSKNLGATPYHIIL